VPRSAGAAQNLAGQVVVPSETQVGSGALSRVMQRVSARSALAHFVITGGRPASRLII
jgi:hypothetical protein